MTTSRNVYRCGFTLLELLLALIVVCGLTFVAVQSVASMTQSMAVTTGATLLDDALTEGRTLALAQNATVEVRIYDVPREAGGIPAYMAMQLHWMEPVATTPAAARIVTLPAGVVIDATATHSTLIALNPETRLPNAIDWNLNAQTRVFHFMPDGSTDLNPSTNWFMTVRAASQSDPARFPSNWACVRVDAVTGKVTIYRP